MDAKNKRSIILLGHSQSGKTTLAENILTAVKLPAVKEAWRKEIPSAIMAGTRSNARSPSTTVLCSAVFRIRASRSLIPPVILTSTVKLSPVSAQLITRSW